MPSKENPSVKLIIGLIYRKNTVKDKVLGWLKKKFGEIDFVSNALVFNHTDYYYTEFGRPLRRMFVSFKNLKREDALSAIKLYTNNLESKFCLKGKRQINIDPGFLNLGKLILATTKDYKHRIYIGKGIFAEVTLFFRKKSFRHWEWTYPDYRTKEYLDIFNRIRQIYAGQIKEL